MIFVLSCIWHDVQSITVCIFRWAPRMTGYLKQFLSTATFIENLPGERF